MGRSDDSYEDSYEDSFWDDYSSESEGSGESNLEDEDSSHKSELQKSPEEDSSIEIEEDYSSYESDTDFWGDYSNESEDEALSSSEYDESEEDPWESTSEEGEESSEKEGAELQDAIDQTYSSREHDIAYYYPHNTDLVTRIGNINLSSKSLQLEVLNCLLICSCQTNATKMNCTQERWTTSQGLTPPPSTLPRSTPASPTPPQSSGRSFRRQSL